jgi:hypothetical protein
MAVTIERTDAVATIVLDRPHARNAVDRPTAEALADAFRAVEADDGLRVAVLWGGGGTFCPASRARPPCSASSAGAGACSSSTAGRCGCRGSSGSAGRWT